MKKLIVLLLPLLMLQLAIFAQISISPSVVSSGGGYFEAENMTISWTLGELAVSTLTGGNMVLTQGFQQSFDFGVGIRPAGADWDISIYPNPVKDELRIRFDIKRRRDFILEVQDVTGRLTMQMIEKGVNPGDVVLINTSKYTEGIYFLKILTPDRQQVQVTSLRKL